MTLIITLSSASTYLPSTTTHQLSIKRTIDLESSNSHRLGFTRRWKGNQKFSSAFIDTPSIISTLASFPREQRYMCAFVTGAIKGLAADLISQTSSKKNRQPQLRKSEPIRGGSAPSNPPHTHSIDVKQSISFLLYSGIYQGMGLELIYNVWMPKVLGDSVALNVAVAMFLVSPFLTLPVAYLFKALVYKTSAKDALLQYWDDVRINGLLTTYWKIWIPVQTFACSMVPKHLRIPFIQAISFIWMLIFTNISTSKKEA
jgi:Mpv17 / PMP22 family